MANPRQTAIASIVSTKHKLDNLDFRSTHVKDLFGVNVFSEQVQRQRLPKPVFKKLQETIHKGAPLDPSIADVVAAAMKDWAVEKGGDTLYAPVPTHDRCYCRKARHLCNAYRHR
ncbi:MAG: hypothetical protein KatS3mg104_1522 [Phycisphaerae bacterium]|nr:MAG: hypothetical protein KatS3mg104_1522 [Phycisphaerae bacterium]